MREIADDLMADEPSFQEVAEALALGVPFRVAVAPDGRSRFVYMGPGCQALTGLAPEAFLADARALAAVMPADDIQRLLVEKRAAMAELRPCRGEFRLRRASGELRWIRLTSAPRLNPDGSSVWNGLMTDVTDARRLGEQLALERRRLELAIDVSGIGVYEWNRDDPDTVIWSDRQYEIFGLAPRTAMTVDGFWSLVHPEDRERAKEQSLEPLRGGDDLDYSMEHRIVRPGGEVRWVLIRGRTTWDGEGLRSIYGTALDVTDRRAAEERRRLQMRELAHRGKNALSLMMAMVHQAARRTRTSEELSGVLMSRLEAMARSQDLVTAWDGAPLPLVDMLTRVLAPFDLTRFDLDPSLKEVTVAGDASIGLGLLLHELATNAVKYGALSNASGRVGFSREPAAGATVLCWREIGGPPVRPPERQGFGSRLMVSALQAKNGTVEPSFTPEGLVVRMRLPD